MVRKIKKYEKFLLDILNDYVERRSAHPVFEYQLIVDSVHHHYQVVRTGWDEQKFLHQVLLHFQIKPDGKIWIWVNKTEVEIDRELLMRGVPPTDIVIGFQSPFMRELSGFAVA
jgi:hypothetical protein